MADKAHIETDLKLEKMERRLSAIYSRAQKEIQETAKKYFDRFEQLDKEKAEAVTSGDMTREEYQRWRLNKIAYGKRYTEMREQIAQQLLNVNRTAMAYVNGELPEVYALNYNALEGTVGGLGGYSFTLTDANTVANLATKEETLLPYKEVDGKKDVRWNTKKVNAEVLQGILQGESMDKIAGRFSKVTEMNRVSAIRNARTTVTSAENKGRQDSYEKATSDGIQLEREWISTNDGRTRHSHRLLDGQTAPVDKPFQSELGPIRFPGDPEAAPANVYNCFVGETNVASDSDVIRSYKHKYSGKMVSVKTSGGVNFTCTPNHPILTPRGWIPAELLQNGDNILVTFCGEDGILRIDPDVDHAFPSMETVHNLLDVSLGERAASMSVNFHGDVPTSNVEIVTKKRFLRENRNSSFGNCVNKFFLKFADKPFPSKCSFMKHFRRIRKSSFRNVCGEGKPFSFLRACLGHSDIHSLRTVPSHDSFLTEYSIDDLPANSVIDGELLYRLSGRVFLDQIVDVNTFVSSCHVYNLQTENGYYFVNTIVPQNGGKCNGIAAIAKNCRCTMAAKVIGFKKTVEKTEPVASYAIKNVKDGIKEAEMLGVKYARFEKMDISHVQNIVDAVKTLPKDCVPKFISNGKDVSTVTGRKLGRKADQWWGVTYDYRLFGFQTMQLGYDKTDYDGGLIVGINTQKFKTPDMIKKSKEENEKRYFERTSHHWNFNTDGRATAFHEIGHCYVDVRGLPDGWDKISKKWCEESKCDLLNSPEEAFAEAWAAYHTGNENLPKYVSDVIKGLK